jgi:plastocyanin
MSSKGELGLMKPLYQSMSTALLASLFLVAAGGAQAGDIKGKITVKGLKSAENIAVYVDAIPGKAFPAPTPHVVLDQKGMSFAPHVVVILKDTTVDFMNSDAVGHNVYWPSVGGDKKLAHNLGTWPQGQKKSFTFSDLGAIALLCNVHPEMSGYLVVAPTPYFAVSDKAGQFVIKDVPPGHYTLKTWSEEGKPTTQPIDVAAGEVEAQLTVQK